MYYDHFLSFIADAFELFMLYEALVNSHFSANSSKHNLFEAQKYTFMYQLHLQLL